MYGSARNARHRERRTGAPLATPAVRTRLACGARARNAFVRLLSAAILGLGLPHLAWAADVPVKAPIQRAPVVAPAYNWTGFYLGANIGGTWSNSTLTNSNLGASWNPGGTGFIGGVQAGYNLQAGNFLFGIEADFDATTFNGSTSPVATLPGMVQASVNKDWIATLAARVGVTSDRWLVYSKIGGGWAQSNAALNVVNGGTIWVGSQTDSGWLIGAGLEYAFADNWTGKLEYDYIGLGNATVSTPPVAIASRDIQMLKVGANYQFGNRVAAAAASGPSGPEAQDTEALARASQNPIASMISLPFQNNTNFNSGPFNRAQDILNIQPVIPMALNSDWNVISRTIVPLVSQPSPIFDSSTNGIGDITQSLFVSPSHPGPLIWGVGPVYTIPSASDAILGTGKVLAGPTAVALVTPGHWVIGVLVNNQWSVAGDANRASVNTFLAQPFINYNMAGGWFLTSSPIITANWLATSGQRWTVPLGGGVGRVFKIDGQAYNASIAAFYNVVHPDNTPNWQLRISLALLFPK
jgi:opacity protein-like surface antigen